jgi:uncharacterized protein (TIGR01777 family)
MHILIGGGSGFVGSALTERFRGRGDRVTWISRTPGPDRITWEDVSAGRLPECDVVINLAGEHILNLRRRWNDEYRRDLVRSRVGTTSALVNALNSKTKPPRVFISTAGKCFYGTAEVAADSNYPELDEYSSPMALDFPASMVALWEDAANAIDTTRIRHIHVRLGIILGAVERISLLGKLWRIGRGRGILPLIRLPFCLGVGAVMGHGRQPMPWIHIDDVVGLFEHLADSRDAHGRYNAVAPGIVSNRKFTEALARQLHRPIAWSAPAWLVRAIVGEDRASILLEGQQVRPKRTLESGYRFRYPDLGGALEDLVKITV